MEIRFILTAYTKVASALSDGTDPLRLTVQPQYI